MCRCCRTSSTGLRIYAHDLEPTAEQPFDDRWEKKIVSMHQIKEELYRLVSEHAQSNRTPLCINPHSAAFKSFTRYVCEIKSSSGDWPKRCFIILQFHCSSPFWITSFPPQLGLTISYDEVDIHNTSLNNLVFRRISPSAYHWRQRLWDFYILPNH